jgi:hypothetical protein
VQPPAGLAGVETGAPGVVLGAPPGEEADGGDLEGAEMVSAGIVEAGRAGGSEGGRAGPGEAAGATEVRDAGDVGPEQLVAEEGAAGIAAGETVEVGHGGERDRPHTKNRFNVAGAKQRDRPLEQQ